MTYMTHALLFFCTVLFITGPGPVADDGKMKEAEAKAPAGNVCSDINICCVIMC